MLAVLLVAWSAAGHPPVRHQIDAIDAALSRDVPAAEQLELRVRRARLLRIGGDATAALQEAERALALDAADADARLERALALSQLGRDAEAHEALGALLEAAPEAPSALAERARIHARNGRSEEAVRDYTAALALQPQVELFLARGELQEALGRDDDAAAGYRDALERLGDAQLLRLALVRVESRRGHHEEALALVDEALARTPVKTEWQLRRAEVLAAAGDAAGAKAARRAALAEANAHVERRPTALSLLARSRAHLALGELSEARADATRALEQSPRLRAARSLLDEIEAQSLGDDATR